MSSSGRSALSTRASSAKILATSCAGQVEQPGDVEAAAAHLQHLRAKRRPSQPGQRM